MVCRSRFDRLTTNDILDTLDTLKVAFPRIGVGKATCQVRMRLRKDTQRVEGARNVGYVHLFLLLHVTHDGVS